MVRSCTVGELVVTDFSFINVYSKTYNRNIQQVVNFSLNGLKLFFKLTISLHLKTSTNSGKLY